MNASNITDLLAVINTQAPFATSHGKDSLDLALIFGSYEQPVSLFFIGDGVFQLVNTCDGARLNIKDYCKTFPALSFYDIENVYLCEDSAKARGLQLENFIDDAQLVSNEVFKAQLSKHKFVLTF